MIKKNIPSPKNKTKNTIGTITIFVGLNKTKIKAKKANTKDTSAVIKDTTYLFLAKFSFL